MRLTTKLSQREIYSQLQQGTATELKDANSPLLLRIHKGRASASWCLELHKNGKTVRPKVADFPNVGVAFMREQLDQLITNFHAANELIVVNDMQFSELCAWYCERELVNRGTSDNYTKTALSLVNKHLLVRLGPVFVSQLDAQCVDKNLIQPMQADGYALSTIKQVYAQLKRIVAQACDVRLVQRNALTDVHFKHFNKSKIKAKAGRLRTGQLADLVAQIKTAAGEVRLFLLLLLAFGTRKTETSLMRYSWIDTVGEPAIVLPASVTKTDDALSLPLGKFVLSEIAKHQVAQRKRGYTGDFIFNHGRGAACANTVDKWVRSVSGGKWSAHDIRKLCINAWIERGVDYLVVQRLVNHALDKVDEAYIFTTVEQGKRAALVAWHSEIAQCFSLENSDRIQTCTDLSAFV